MQFSEAYLAGMPASKRRKVIKIKPLTRFYLLVSSVAETLLSVQKVCCSNPGSVKSDTVSPTARHRCDVSSELCCIGAMPRTRVPPLVTRFGVITRL